MHIKAEVLAKLDHYKGRSVLEQCAIFLRKAQVLELGHNRLLAGKFNVSHEEMESRTLGKTKNERRDRGLLPGFIGILESVVAHGNNMAHGFVVSTKITRSIANFSDRRLYGGLFRALYKMEQIIILHDWCAENDGWLPRAEQFIQYDSASRRGLVQTLASRDEQTNLGAGT